MEHRGRHRSQSVHPKGKDPRQDPRQDRGQCYPPPDPRDWDRAWAHHDSQFRPPLTSPVSVDPYAYGHQQQYPYGYGWTEQQRPHSRHGYDYPVHGHWDYRDNYYYEQDFYRGQLRHPEAAQRGQQESWQREPYQENADKKENSTAERYEQRKETSRHYKGNHEDAPHRDNGDATSSYNLGTLESSKTSGLSSSSYELSLYINGAERSDPAPQPGHSSDTEQNHQLSAPLKYSVPHAVVSFGPAGQLIRVSAGFSSQKNVGQLEIHSMEVILSETQEQQEMRKFPGPLTREDLHKVDAIEFAHQMAGACLRDDKLHDKSSAALLWNLLILLCRQNGQIVGSDIAELLVRGSRVNGGGQSESASLIDFSEGSAQAEAPPSEEADDLLTGHRSQEGAQRAMRSYTQLLLAGRKKDALESAMSSGLWGHALFLASKMDNRSYTTVLNRFTGQLAANDPLQTLFQLLSGRVPAVAACCGSEKWGDWRPHLAVILANETEESVVKQKAIATIGDTLASRGLLYSAHVCYLTAGLPFGAFTQKDERLVLLGSSHRQTFKDFSTNTAIRCTELFEYCQNLGGKCFSLPSFQVYKFLYASRLLDSGLSSQAFHYCEVVGQAILRQNEPMLVLTDLLLKLADRLRHSELSEAGLSGAQQDPGWVTQLRFRHQRLQTGSYNFSEIHQALPESAGDYSPVQSPEPELLYYRVAGENSRNNYLDENLEVAATDSRGVYEWSQSAPPVPPPEIYAPPVPSVAANQNFTYNTNTTVIHGPVTSASDASPLPPSSTIESPVTADGNQSHEIRQMQMPPINHDEHYSPSKQTGTSGGWFSGWFKSKPKDVQQETSEQSNPPQTFPASDVRPPPSMFPPQPSSSTGINPFSRKAGQQLG